MTSLSVTKESLTALVINYNTAPLTARCVRSLASQGLTTVMVLDNASERADFEALEFALSEIPECKLIHSERNLGFAGGSNLLITSALARANCTHVLLLNSDAILASDGLRALLATALHTNADLVGGRVNLLIVDDDGKEHLTDTIESHGIALYKTLLASNRKHSAEAYLGPTGGCALLSRVMLENVLNTHGYVFDSDYFCYAEDTDLCIRATLLGHPSAHTDQVVAYHQGQASSGGGFSDFVYYHGIRNSVWTLIKSVPATLLIRKLPWVLLLHAGIIVRHTVRGKFRLTLRIYWDAFRRLPALLRKRRLVSRSSFAPDSTARLDSCITPWFYEPDYLRGAINDLLGRKPADPQ